MKNVNIDQTLLTKAQTLSGLSEEETINLALKEFVERRKKDQLSIKTLFNTIEYNDDYDHKKLRNRKPK